MIVIKYVSFPTRVSAFVNEIPIQSIDYLNIDYVTEGNAVLVFRNIVFTICYRQITYFFVCYIVARNLNF